MPVRPFCWRSAYSEGESRLHVTSFTFSVSAGLTLRLQVEVRCRCGGDFLVPIVSRGNNPVGIFWVCLSLQGTLL
ncbi:dTDP-3,4-didehydro-2,6-dideoxy-alpha-D-glucose 3-reductase [Fusarium oxysporum f. sp. albedinis]|nr:dTDP-3,4-didehydro-2,6-dideoxy-alpha-D-glucose 3-reductase [Fusarium oxysporum f. sp. albedinis]